MCAVIRMVALRSGRERARASESMEMMEWACTDEGSEPLACACPLGRALLVHVEDVAGMACDVEGEAADNLKVARHVQRMTAVGRDVPEAWGLGFQLPANGLRTGLGHTPSTLGKQPRECVSWFRNRPYSNRGRSITALRRRHAHMHMCTHLPRPGTLCRMDCSDSEPGE